jgi:hypothetical protein
MTWPCLGTALLNDDYLIGRQLLTGCLLFDTRRRSSDSFLALSSKAPNGQRRAISELALKRLQGC